MVLSCEFCKIFKNTVFYRTPSVAASEMLSRYSKLVNYNLKASWQLNIC